MTLSNVFVAVEYYDHHVKCQAWPRDFIARTDRLVFSPDLMDEPERKAISRERRNWRLNPCMARYLHDGDSELICERGDGRALRRLRTGGGRPTQVRGSPVGIEFMFSEGGDLRSYHFDATWMRDTAALEFRQDALRNGGFAITRIELNGDKTDLDVVGAGFVGTMPCRVPPDSYPCWYGESARARRC